MSERRLFWIREQQKHEKLEQINDDVHELELSTVDHNENDLPFLSDLNIPPEVILT